VSRLKQRARALKIELHAFWLAFRHPRTPWYAKALLVLVLAYAANPFDLIPDFIPLLGMLDDLVIISLGIALAVRLIPDDVVAECRKKAREADAAGGFTAFWRK
jgi:uncharacterized membrane protein YkvA (DUF1232 family)